MPYLEDITVPWRLHNVNGEAIVEDWTEDRLPRAQLTFRVHWSDRAQFKTELRGGFLPDATTLGDYTEPARLAYKADHFCLGVSSVRGYGRWKRGVDGYDPFKWAIVTAEFGVPEFDIVAASNWRQVDPVYPIYFCKQKVRASAAYVVLPEGRLKFSDSGKTVTQELSKPAAQSEVTLEFPWVPFNMPAAVKPYLGTVNLNPMLNHVAGQVLLEAIDLTANGFVLTYLCRDADWNAIVNSDGEFELVEFDIIPDPLDPTPKRPFEYTDLMALFTDTLT